MSRQKKKEKMSKRFCHHCAYLLYYYEKLCYIVSTQNNYCSSCDSAWFLNFGSVLLNFHSVFQKTSFFLCFMFISATINFIACVSVFSSFFAALVLICFHLKVVLLFSDAKIYFECQFLVFLLQLSNFTANLDFLALCGMCYSFFLR